MYTECMYAQMRPKKIIALYKPTLLDQNVTSHTDVLNRILV